MSPFRFAGWIAILVALAGCATKPQPPVELAPSALTSPAPQRVGVVLAPIPKPALHLPGADCLLCIIAAQVANSGIGKHVDTLDAKELLALQDALAAGVRRRGGTPVVITDTLAVKDLADAPASTTPNAARKDFRPLRQKYGVGKLLVVDIQSLGLQRNYSAYIPAGAPHAMLGGTGYLVDLTSNTYDWYQAVHITQTADGNWDEPPAFPALTNAYFQTLEKTKDRLLEPWRP